MSNFNYYCDYQVKNVDILSIALGRYLNSPNQDMQIAIGCNDGSIYIYEMNYNKSLCILTTPSNASVCSMISTTYLLNISQLDNLIVGDIDGIVTLYNNTLPIWQIKMSSYAIKHLHITNHLYNTHELWAIDNNGTIGQINYDKIEWKKHLPYICQLVCINVEIGEQHTRYNLAIANNKTEAFVITLEGLTVKRCNLPCIMISTLFDGNNTYLGGNDCCLYRFNNWKCEKIYEWNQNIVHLSYCGKNQIIMSSYSNKCILLNTFNANIIQEFELDDWIECMDSIGSSYIAFSYNKCQVRVFIPPPPSSSSSTS